MKPGVHALYMLILYHPMLSEMHSKMHSMHVPMNYVVEDQSVLTERETE